MPKNHNRMHRHTHTPSIEKNSNSNNMKFDVHNLLIIDMKLYVKLAVGKRDEQKWVKEKSVIWNNIDWYNSARESSSILYHWNIEHIWLPYVHNIHFCDVLNVRLLILMMPFCFDFLLKFYEKKISFNLMLKFIDLCQFVVFLINFRIGNSIELEIRLNSNGN